jgi:hypothetical protein
MIFGIVEFLLILLMVIVIDGRLYRLRKIELGILKELQFGNSSQPEIVKALQWRLDNWNKPPPPPA